MFLSCFRSSQRTIKSGNQWMSYVFKKPSPRLIGKGEGMEQISKGALPHIDVGGEFKNSAHFMLESATLRAWKPNSPPTSH